MKSVFLNPLLLFGMPIVGVSFHLPRTTSNVRRSLVRPAVHTSEEDLELTRQVILGKLLEQQQPEQEPDDTAATTTTTTPASSTKTRSYYQPAISERPRNDLMMRAAVGATLSISSSHTPVWLFRQAGRHLPEYRQYKASTGRSFLQLLSDPASVAECTLQPVRRYPVDAAILFSDILVVAEALGVSVTMPGGVGIQVPEPLQSPDDIATRLPDIGTVENDEALFVQTKLGHVLAAVKEIRKLLAAEDRSIPLIGFSAAPWTLLFYMVGGSSKKNTDIGMKWLKEYPAASRQLLELLTTTVIEYMSAQVEAGCHMLQIFEAMGMMIRDEEFEQFAMPCLKRIGETLKERFPDTPLMIFCRGACHMNDKVAALGCFDVITIDGSVDRSTVRNFVGPDVALQGNYDPAELIAENGKTPETVRTTAREMLEQLGPHKLIANLGEGLGGKESPELVQAFCDAIHEESAQMIKNMVAEKVKAVV